MIDVLTYHPGAVFLGESQVSFTSPPCKLPRHWLQHRDLHGAGGGHGAQRGGGGHDAGQPRLHPHQPRHHGHRQQGGARPQCCQVTLVFGAGGGKKKKKVNTNISITHFFKLSKVVFKIHFKLS